MPKKTAAGCRLGVNIDHIATVRQARGTDYPDPVEAGLIAAAGGADSLTIHLREDRRHIQEHDVRRLIARCPVPVNLEMAVNGEMLEFAAGVRPQFACLVPERRQELTTEGGLDVAGNLNAVRAACRHSSWRRPSKPARRTWKFTPAPIARRAAAPRLPSSDGLPALRVRRTRPASRCMPAMACIWAMSRPSPASPKSSNSTSATASSRVRCLSACRRQ
jgi:hypothetical protein